MMDCQEYREIIAAHVDGALSSEEGLAVQSHLDRCARCTQRFLWETQVKKALKEKFSGIPIIPGLKERILDQVGETRREGFFGRFYTPHALAAAFVLLLIVAIPYFFWEGRFQEEVFTNAIEQYQQLAQGIASAPERASTPIPPAQLLDLSPWGYRLLARQTQQVKGKERRVFVYRGTENEYVVAQEFERSDFSPPSGAGAVRRSNQDFIIYSREGVNLIAWKEKDKDLLCILASSLPQERLLGLAQKIATRS